MGKLRMTITIPIEGEDQQLDYEAKVCENPNCERGPKGTRKYFPPKGKNHKYCSGDCKTDWNNKRN